LTVQPCRVSSSERVRASSRRNADAVVVWDLDRLTRRPLEVEEFIDLADRRGVALASVGGDVDLSTDNGRLFARIKGAVARSEVERKSIRQRSANDQRAASGIPSAGRRPYAYAPDGLTLVEAEAEHLRHAVTSLLEGQSVRSLARDLSERGARTTAGNPWRPTQLRRTLVNPRYCGLRVHRGEVVGNGAWSPLIDEGTHAAIVAVLADPQRHSAGPARRYLLSGIARCGVCGGKVFGVGEKAKGPLYRCETRLHINRRAGVVDELVGQAVVARLQREDAVDLLSTAADAEHVGGFRKRGDALRARLDDMAEAFAAGDIDRRQLAKGSATLRGQIEAVTSKLADQARTPVLAELLAAVDVPVAWEALPFERKRAVIETLLRIRLMPPGRGARTFDPETVVMTWTTAA